MLPLYSSTPGIAVKVVNSYAAASLAVFVILDKTKGFQLSIKHYSSLLTRRFSHRWEP